MTGRGTGDEDLDETLEETFPASDAPANTVETAAREPRSCAQTIR